ncbi:MAG: DUF3536 domain-containing protein [Syntrophorhabdus sp.]
MERYIAIHCHFYQPPRENPWLESIEVQDSAYPYHDWNERITAECYGPNSASRIVNAFGKVTDIVSNYSKISFNFGPTLLSWMADQETKVYDAIIEADRQSVRERGGHGNAIAQVYNHLIMPLANERDKVTQVKWGIRDFAYRFGRQPEGMWLAETAVDIETLESLAREGIRFTILAPYQAHNIRKIGSQEWQDVTGGTIDPTRAYLCKLPSGHDIVIFFYDGPISRGIAFEDLLGRGENLAGRLASAFNDSRDWPQIVHIATDGETYGHHKRFGDMALAFALHHIEESGIGTLTNYGQYLEKHPPDHEVEIYENTSWSCAHGVERWRSNCGCNSGGHSWNQEWRGPLRDALNWLRDDLADKYWTEGSKYLKNPWMARNNYIDVILDRNPGSIETFLKSESKRELSSGEKLDVLKLLEIQRHCLLMFTSCGWFFDELSGIETVQVIEYAGRAIQLMFDVLKDGGSTEEKFTKLLAAAKSNIPEHKDGENIYYKWVKPAAINHQKVAIHYAISSAIQDYSDKSTIFSFEVDKEDYSRIAAGTNTLVVGNADIISRITQDSQRISFAVLHLGGNVFNGGAREFITDETYNEMKERVFKGFEKGDIAAVIHAMDHYFGMHSYSLQDLFRDTQHKILDLLVKETLENQDDLYRNAFQASQILMNVLVETGMPVPNVFRASAEYTLNLELKKIFQSDTIDEGRVASIVDQMAKGNLSYDTELEIILRHRLEKEMLALEQDPVNAALMNRICETMGIARQVPVTLNLWDVQNIYYGMINNVYPDMFSKIPEVKSGETGWMDSFRALGETLDFDYGAIIDRQRK